MAAMIPLDVPPPAAAAVVSLDRSVTGANDDAEEYADGGMTLDSTDLELVRDGGHGNQVVGLRFVGIAVPQGATVTAASVQLRVDEASNIATSLVIRAEASDHAQPFATNARNISSRPTTTANVGWSPPAWTTIGAAGQDQATPDLAAVIGEVVARPGWSSGNALVLTFQGSGTRIAESVDGGFASRLHIEYSGDPAAGGAPVIDALSPGSAPTGSEIRVLGTNLSSVTTVTFNGVAASFSVISSAEIRAIVPPAATSGPVRVTNSVGTAVSPGSFTVAAAAGPEIRVPQDYPTIQAAVDAARTGQKVIVSPGVYREAVVIAGKRITLASEYELTGNAAAIDATVIESDTVKPGILVQANAADSAIVGLTIRVDPSAPRVNLIDGVKSLASMSVISCRIVGFDDGIDFDPPGQTPAFATIVGNTLEDGSDDGIDFDGPAAGRIEANVSRNNHEDGMEVRLYDNTAHLELLVRGNTFTGNGQDGMQIIDLPGASDRVFTIERNVFDSNARAGLGLMDDGKSGEDYRAASLLDAIRLFNNVFSGNHHGLSGGDNVVAVNNIFAGSSTLAVSGVDGGSIVAHTLFWANGTNFSGSTVDESSTAIGNPLFTADFRLEDESPAIDTGVASYSHAGQTVLTIPPAHYAGAAPDLGAHETADGSGPPPPPQDTTPPNTTITGGPSGTVSDTSASFTYTSSEAGSTFGCALDGAPFSPCPPSGTTYAGLAVGDHSFAVRATDGAANTDPTPATRAWTVEAGSTSPTRPVNLGEVGRATSAVNASTLPFTTTRTVGAGTMVIVGIGFSGNPGATPSVSDSSGNVYTIDVRRDNGTSTGTTGALASSLIRNQLPVGSTITVNLPRKATYRLAVAYAYSGLVAVDKTASATGQSATPSSGQTATITSAPQVVLGVTVYGSGSAAHAPGLGLAELAELHAGTKSLAIDERIVDATGGYGDAGTLSASAIWTDSVATYAAAGPGSGPPPPPQDTTPPNTTITGGPSGTVSDTSASFTYTSSEAGSTFGCALDGAPFSPCPPSGTTYAGLAVGDHSFAVRATDGAANTDPTPATRAWTVEAGSTDIQGVLVGAGDIASCGSSGDEATATLLDSIGGTVFTTGDNVYGGTGVAQYAQCYGPSWGRHLDRTRPSAGNHDYDEPGATGYYDYFGAAAGEPAKGYYSYNLGTWHVIVLNSNCAAVGGCGAGSAQEQWLRADLAASAASCTLAYWHHPRFSTGQHGDSVATQPFWQALHEAGAELVLAGHDHSYQRFRPLNASGAPDDAFGLRSFVVGTGGASHYATALGPNTVVADGSTYGVLKLTLRNESYDWQFVPVAGGTFTDAGSSACHGAPAGTPPDTTAPDTSISSGPATSTTSTAASFSFAATEPTATFACSFDGGTFAPCTSPLTRTGLAPGQHTFRVRATDVAGNTDPSPATYSWTIEPTGGSPATLAFAPTADAEVDAAAPASNFGGLAAMVVDTSPASEAVLRFAVAGVSGPVTQATLRLYSFGQTTNGPQLRTTSHDWSESTITWNSRPAGGSLVGNAGAVPRNTWVEFDVTSVVTGNGDYDFLLQPEVSDGVDFYSREGPVALRPQLMVTVGP